MPFLGTMFLSAAPEVKLVRAFQEPFRNAVATARTCYSGSGIIADPELDERTTRIAQSIYAAGHHTTLQHAHFQFTLANVSRHFLWSFLHSHPFYNSEQVSQRYVRVKPETFAVPPLEGRCLDIYLEAVRRQQQRYEALITLLEPLVAEAYYGIFPARRKRPRNNVPRAQRDVRKKAQEMARYVLPVATFAYLYHTVSGITLLRYYRLCQEGDCPLEQRLVVGAMVEELLNFDPNYRLILEEPLEALPYEEPGAASLGPRRIDCQRAREFTAEFDAALGGLCSRLIDAKPENEPILADAVRGVLGLSRGRLSDDAAIALVLDPARNPILGETLNLTTLSKLSRALSHPSYTFRKKLSHTADSQNQRHRMTPASRPCLAAHFTGEPDYVTPPLVRRDAAAADLYRTSMEESWQAMRQLLDAGTPAEFALYLLPNATAVRFTESADLLNLHHKHAMRLCYNAQEEIWQASVEEARQISQVNPRIGRYLLPPCTLRVMAKTRPICPEGDRFCGVKVWSLKLDDYQRVI
ncbi:MAG: FAD-dependent thymidylate synthase [Candidatus Tectomicrobia bacterium]|nr:FAD-dependent thymidylate synthase [Candidatus Tectomicrobia bacterium]